MYKQPVNAAANAMAEQFILADAKKAAQFFSTLPTHEALSLLSAVSADALVLCIDAMDTERAGALLRRMNIKQSALVLSRVNIARAALITASLPEHFKKKLLQDLPSDLAARLEGALVYRENTAGAMCSGNYFAFKTDDKIADIINKFKNLPRKKMAGVVYITDKQGALLGIIKTGDIVFLKDDASAGSAMLKEFVSLKADADKEQVLAAFKEASAAELPVTDGKNILLGVINIRTLLQEIQPKGLIKKIMGI